MFANPELGSLPAPARVPTRPAFLPLNLENEIVSWILYSEESQSIDVDPNPTQLASLLVNVTERVGGNVLVLLPDWKTICDFMECLDDKFLRNKHYIVCNERQNYPDRKSVPKSIHSLYNSPGIEFCTSKAEIALQLDPVCRVPRVLVALCNDLDPLTSAIKLVRKNFNFAFRFDLTISQLEPEFVETFPTNRRLLICHAEDRSACSGPAFVQEDLMEPIEYSRFQRSALPHWEGFEGPKIDYVSNLIEFPDLTFPRHNCLRSSIGGTVPSFKIKLPPTPGRLKEMEPCSTSPSKIEVANRPAGNRTSRKNPTDEELRLAIRKYYEGTGDRPKLTSKALIPGLTVSWDGENQWRLRKIKQLCATPDNAPRSLAELIDEVAGPRFSFDNAKEAILAYRKAHDQAPKLNSPGEVPHFPDLTWDQFMRTLIYHLKKDTLPDGSYGPRFKKFIRTVLKFEEVTPESTKRSIEIYRSQHGGKFPTSLTNDPAPLLGCTWNRVNRVLKENFGSTLSKAKKEIRATNEKIRKLETI